MIWNPKCKYAPTGFAKHCKQVNEGKESQSVREMRAKQGKGGVGKGRWGCAKHCRYLEGLK